SRWRHSPPSGRAIGRPGRAAGRPAQRPVPARGAIAGAYRTGALPQAPASRARPPARGRGARERAPPTGSHGPPAPATAIRAFAPAPSDAVGDPDRVLQVTSNLVENALRLTPRGGVVRVSAEPGALVVEDTGPGLSAEDLPRAFERFYLYSRYSSDRPVGTGLGLSIVKELIQGMGGSVDVETTSGRGTKFTVRLPGADGLGFTDGLRAANRDLTPAGEAAVAESDQEVLR